MNNIHKAHSCLTILILLGTLTQSNSTISQITNESENMITIAFMVCNLKKFGQFTPAIWNSECKEYKMLNEPIELEPNETITIDAPAPQAHNTISTALTFDETPDATPVYLQIKTKRRTQKKLRRSSEGQEIMYQDATFNIISGFHEDLKRESLWAQKIVNGKVTSLQALSFPAEAVALTIDINGCPLVTTPE